MKIKLKQKKLKSGLKSLYIEYYNGSYIDTNGQKKHNREFEYLKLYIDSETKDKDVKTKNKETLDLANKILSIRQSDYYQGKYKIKLKRENKFSRILCSKKRRAFSVKREL